MAGVSSRIAAAALTLGASASLYGYANRDSHSHAESICSCEEFSQNRGNKSKSTRVPHEAGNQMSHSRARNFLPVCAPQFDGLNFFETIVIPAKKIQIMKT